MEPAVCLQPHEHRRFGVARKALASSFQVRGMSIGGSRSREVRGLIVRHCERGITGCDRLPSSDKLRRFFVLVFSPVDGNFMWRKARFMQRILFAIGLMFAVAVPASHAQVFNFGYNTTVSGKANGCLYGQTQATVGGQDEIG